MSNVSPRSAYSFIPGKSLRTWVLICAQISTGSFMQTVCMKRKSPFHTVCRTGFSGIVTQFSCRLVPDAKLSIRAVRIRKISIPITRRSNGDCQSGSSPGSSSSHVCAFPRITSVTFSKMHAAFSCRLAHCYSGGTAPASQASQHPIAVHDPFTGFSIKYAETAQSPCNT